MEEFANIVVGLVFLGVVAVLYFLPTIVANNRKHPNAVPIFLVNLLLGITGIGYIVALVWSFTDTGRRT